MTEFFARLPTDDFVWHCVVSGVAALAGFGFSFLFLYRKRLMEDMPTARIRSAHQGYVELEGTAKLLEGPPIIAPLTHGHCVWWRYKIEEKRKSGKNTNWVKIDSGCSEEIFALEDRTGRCVVDPTGAKVIPAARQVWYGSGRRPDRGPAMGGGFWRSAFCKYRYTEERIPPNGPVYALGGFRTQTGGPEAFDEQADIREMLNKWKGDKRMMALFDVNKDGTVDVKEWEAARRMATGKVRAEHVQIAVETPDVNILGKPKDSRPFILSGIPQATLIRRHLLQAVGCLAVFAGAGSYFVMALLSRHVL